MTKPLRILLADDSRFFRTIEAKFLQKTPSEILEADCVEATLQVTEQIQPDLIYLAYNILPDGGVNCCKRIKADAATKHIPVVMICDQEQSEEQVAKARQAGCDEVLVKPLDRLQFLQAGRKFLSSIREHRHPCFFNLNIDFDGLQISGKCLDISGGGMFLETKAEVPVGTLFDFSFRLPDARSTPIRCRAEVKWLNRRPNPMKPHYPQGLGLSFVEIDVAAQRAIMLHTQNR